MFNIVFTAQAIYIKNVFGVPRPTFKELINIEIFFLWTTCINGMRLKTLNLYKQDFLKTFNTHDRMEKTFHRADKTFILF